MKQHDINSYRKVYFEDCRMRRRLSEKTIKAYTIDLHQFFAFMKTDLEDSKRIVEYIHYLNQRYPKYKTVKRKLASIKAFYAFLEYEEYITCTPFRKIRTQSKEPLRLPRTISFEHNMQIFDYLYEKVKNAKTDYEKRTAYRNTAVIELLFATGIRISELCNLKLSDFNFQEQSVKIFGKGSKERMLYLGNDDMILMLKKYYEQIRSMKEDDYFFVNRYGNRLSEQSIRILLRSLEKELHLPIHITPHMFRHTFATMLLEKDVDIRYIQRILGHSSISITQIYTHVSYPKQREIMTLKNPRNDIHV